MKSARKPVATFFVSQTDSFKCDSGSIEPHQTSLRKVVKKPKRIGCYVDATRFCLIILRLHVRYGSGLFKSGILTYQNGALEPIKGFLEPAVKFLEPVVYKSGSFYYI